MAAKRDPIRHFRASDAWVEAVDELAGKLRVSRATLFGESVRLLAETHGVSLPPRNSNRPDQSPELSDRIDLEPILRLLRQS